MRLGLVAPARTLRLEGAILAAPLALAGGGVVTDRADLLHVALIWVAHIGADRAMGYGLKYPTHFRDTHLQRLT